MREGCLILIFFSVILWLLIIWATFHIGEIVGSLL